MCFVSLNILGIFKMIKKQMYFKAIDFEIENVGCKIKDSLLVKCIVYSCRVKECRNLILARTVNIWDIETYLKYCGKERQKEAVRRLGPLLAGRFTGLLESSSGFRPIITSFNPIFFVSPPVMYTSARLDTLAW